MFTVVGAAPAKERPEARRVIQDLQVADLVPNDVLEHRLGGEQQSPVEAHRTVARAARPARPLSADAEPGVRRARDPAGAVEARLDLALSGAAIPALDGGCLLGSSRH